MKLLAKDLSNGQTVATTAIDVLTTGKLTTTNVFSGIGLDLATQSSRPANVAKGLWLNNSNALRFYNGTTDYEVAHSGTSLAGDVSGTLGATVVADDSHSHSNTTLTGVPGSGIDTTAIHSGDSTGGDLSGTLPTNVTVVKIQGNAVLSGTPTNGDVLTWVTANSRWEAVAPTPAAHASSHEDGGGDEVIVENLPSNDTNTGYYLMSNGDGTVGFAAVTGTLPSGTVDKSIIHWDNGGGSWEEVTNLKVDDSGNLTSPASGIFGDTEGGDYVKLNHTPGEVEATQNVLSPQGQFDTVMNYSAADMSISPSWDQSGAAKLTISVTNAGSGSASIEVDAKSTIKIGLATSTGLELSRSSVTTAVKGALTVAEHLTFPTDNTYDIGASGATRPRTGYFGTSAVIAGKTAMKADDSTGGDLSGTYPTTITVAKIQGRTVASTAPSNGQMLTWNSSLSQWEPQTPAGGATTLPQLNDVYSSMSPADEQVFYYDGPNNRWDAKYPGVVNESGNKTFVVLVAGTSAADINTALTNYDVVYLEPGTYSCGTTALTIPNGKSLVGLGNPFRGTYASIAFATNGPSLRHILMEGGHLENVRIRPDTPTTHIVEGSATAGQESNTAKAVRIEVQTAGGSANKYGFYGYFRKISEVTIGESTNLGVNGIYILGRNAYYEDTAGPIVVENFYITAAPDCGIKLGTVSHIIFRDGYIAGQNGTTDYGVQLITPTAVVTDVHFENIKVDQAYAGFYISGTSSYDVTAYFKNCSVLGKTGYSQFGFLLQYCDYSTLQNCYADYINAGSNNHGFYFQLCDYLKMSGCTARYINNVTDYAFYFNGTNYSTISDLSSYASNQGLYFSGNSSTIDGVTITSSTGAAFTVQGSRLSLSNFDAVLPTSYGGYFYATFSTYANLNVYDGGYWGFVFDGTDYCTFTGINAYSCNGYGIYFSNVDYCAGGGFQSDNNANHGVYLNACTRMSLSGISARANTGTNIDGLVLASCSYCALSAITAGNNSRYGVHLSSMTACSLSGITVFGSGSHGLYISGSGCVSGVLATGNTGSGVFIGTNNYLSVGDVMSNGNTGVGFSYGTSPTTANASSLSTITSKNNTGGSWTTSGNWNTSALWG